jgi:cytochrome c oxidase subunit 3
VTDLVLSERPLPVGSTRRNTVAWWGVLCLIGTEGALFAYLLFSYYYTALQLGDDFGQPRHPQLELSLPNTVVLLTSSVFVWWGDRSIKRGRYSQFFMGYGIGLLLGIAFLVIQTFEWRSQTFSLTSGLYGSLFFTVTGFHMAHVVVGVVALASILLWARLGYFDENRCVPVLVAAAYWHFVDAVWIAVFFTFYLTPFFW